MLSGKGQVKCGNFSGAAPFHRVYNRPVKMPRPIYLPTDMTDAMQPSLTPCCNHTDTSADHDFLTALTDDLDGLIRLYDRELDATTLAALKAVGFPLNLGLLPDAGETLQGFGALRQWLLALPETAATLDGLAADYAGLWLNGGVSPYESVWLDEDHLTCQQPMFELRELYARHGLKVADWRQRYDDHLVLQLQFIRHLLRQPVLDAALLADLIDEHLGYWLPDFAARVSQQADTPLYAGLGQITLFWLTTLRQWLADIHARPLPDQESLAARIRKKQMKPAVPAMPIKFMPGTGGPSW